jgi:hypothetical protein
MKRSKYMEEKEKTEQAKGKKESDDNTLRKVC